MDNPYHLNKYRFSKYTILKNLIGKNKKILDIGCNKGYLAEYCDSNNKFYGLDNNKSAIEDAKKHMKAEVYDLNNVTDLPESWGNDFDIIIFADVLEHINAPEKVLIFFVSKYLKKDGLAIISLPNVANWKIRLNLLFGNFNYSNSGILDKTHLKLYTYKTGRELINSVSALKIVDETASSKFFGIIISKLRFTKGLFAHSMVFICRKSK